MKLRTKLLSLYLTSVKTKQFLQLLTYFAQDKMLI